MTAELGSYPYGQFRLNAVELKRLKQQAHVGLTQERALWSALGLEAGMSVLDLGSGPGIISCELARVAASGAVLGIDGNPKMVAIAKAIAEDDGVQNVRFALGDARQLDLPDASFDFAYSRFLYQHLADPRSVTRELLRVLKPGGRLAIVDVDDAWLLVHPEPPAFQPFLRRAQAAQRRLGGNRCIGRELPGLLTAAGFGQVKGGIVPITSFDISLSNLLEIVTGFKRELIADDELAAASQEVDAIRALAQHDGAWAAVGVFFASGTKLDELSERV